ncbi:MAG: hypothetical protein CMP59_01505 [Flavobacteriales bacterium]|nr:hypothetical protein [Flavobacteriales bacterium]|tara:strand:- start:1810 stop:2274 length:465 start_codon:yes stop_codon:yes gene_type:complete
MKLSQFKAHLSTLSKMEFKLPSGETVAPHYHITEVGKISKAFIDCGGKYREESKVSLQLYIAEDFDHRLSAAKTKAIVEGCETKLALDDLEVEVEYQGRTIEKYGLRAMEGGFEMTSTQTDCLAKDGCGIEKPKVKLSEIGKSEAYCDPNSNCC